MKVLIVEDDPTTSHLMKHVVGQHADYLHAENGQKAYDSFCDALEENDGFDLIFLDIMMPIADGQEVLQAIRDFEEKNGIVQGQGVRVVMTTAIQETTSIYEALASGASEYLTKPIKTEKIVQIIEDAKQKATSHE
ncbi:response regulator [bacterium]|nr:response regulator [bacterium]